MFCCVWSETENGPVGSLLADCTWFRFSPNELYVSGEGSRALAADDEAPGGWVDGSGV